MTKQTTGALQFMVAFDLRGGGGNSSGNTVYLTSLCPGRREVHPRLNQHASREHLRTRYTADVSSTRQPCCVQARQRLLCQSKGQTAESKHVFARHTTATSAPFLALECSSKYINICVGWRKHNRADPPDFLSGHAYQDGK